ncbi:MAG: DUF2844 domain-containing protein [Bacillota bacterium]
MLRKALLVSTVTTFFSMHSMAALGDQFVGTSSTSTKIKPSTSGSATYTVAESTDANGIFIRQYVDSGGLVFAIAWKGSFVPDLENVLGGFTADFRKSISKKGKLRGGRRLKVDTGFIVVEGGGRQRDQSGRAYIPVRVPAGFDLKDINSDE